MHPTDPLHVMVVGAGMYACGRGTNGFGTVLPAIVEAARSEQLVRRLTACATSVESVQSFRHKANDLAAEMRFNLPLDVFPETAGPHDAPFLQAIDKAESGGDPIDAAIVVVPDHLHHEVGGQLVDQGIHTLLVKPFVPQVAQAKDLIQRAERSGVIGMVEFHKRWDQSNLLLRDRLQAGEIGDPLWFHIEYSQRKVIPEKTFAAWVDRTNIFQYLGVHYADMVYFLTGATPTRVMAIGHYGWLRSRGIDTHDAIQTLIEWQSQDRTFCSNHLTHWVDPNGTSAMSDQLIKVVGTRGRIECDQKHRGMQVVSDSGGIEEVNPYFSTLVRGPDGRKRFAGYGYESIRTFLRDVIDVRAGRQSVAALRAERPSFQDSLVSTAIVEANNRSLEQGGSWVAVEY